MESERIAGRRFWKMSGSGNDFVFLDGRSEGLEEFEQAAVIRRICARGTGVGADGLVILRAPKTSNAGLGLVYFNADGSPASLCGNATLCTTSLAARLGATDRAGFALETGSGVLQARIRGGVPEFDLPPIQPPAAENTAIAAASGEERLGFAVAGIPHVVIKVQDVSRAPVLERGREVRNHASLADGANVNFVSQDGNGGWRIRTYERGVEGETLACGTGSVASAVLLGVWGDATGDVELRTASGRVLGVRSTQAADGSWRASLRGEGRVVFEGELGDI